jgi:hypothetical protein
MNDLESSCHEKNYAKRSTQFGVLDQKLWLVEVPCTLDDHLAISA